MQTIVYRSWVKVHRELKSFVLKKVKDNDLAEDIVQDVFLKIHTKHTQVRDADKIVGWIFRVAHNRIIDQYRRKSRDIHPIDLDWEDEEHALNICVARCLNELVPTLPHKYRQALELAEIKKLPQRQLATQLGISYSGAKSRVQRARQKLKEKLDELYLIEADKYGNIIRCEDRRPCCCDVNLAQTLGCK